MASMLRLIVLAIAMVSANALRVPVVASTQPALARTSNVQMAMPSVDDARNLSSEEIEQELVTAKKELFELRKKIKTRQTVKPHLFTHTKHRIGQLQTLLSQRAA